MHICGVSPENCHLNAHMWSRLPSVVLTKAHEHRPLRTSRASLKNPLRVPRADNRSFVSEPLQAPFMTWCLCLVQPAHMLCSGAHSPPSRSFDHRTLSVCSISHHWVMEISARVFHVLCLLNLWSRIVGGLFGGLLLISLQSFKRDVRICLTPRTTSLSSRLNWIARLDTHTPVCSETRMRPLQS